MACMAKENRVVQDIRAWRELLPDWRPTLGELQRLDTGPDEYLVALRSVAREWSPNDARWDVLMALFEYERRKTLREYEARWRQERAVGWPAPEAP
jgi:hypothetical protein